MTLNFVPVSLVFLFITLCYFNLSATCTYCRSTQYSVTWFLFPAIKGQWGHLSLRSCRHLCIIIVVFLCVSFLQKAHQITLFFELCCYQFFSHDRVISFSFDGSNGQQKMTVGESVLPYNFPFPVKTAEVEGIESSFMSWIYVHASEPNNRVLIMQAL